VTKVEKQQGRRQPKKVRSELKSGVRVRPTSPSKSPDQREHAQASLGTGASCGRIIRGSPNRYRIGGLDVDLAQSDPECCTSSPDIATSIKLAISECWPWQW
jgi:hypothetical protein